MKRNLLDLTQSILSSLDSDEVNSISDSAESRQVAEIIKTVYYNIISRADLPEHNELFQLDPSTDETLPVIMYRPEHVSKIEWLKYYNINTSNTDTSTFVHDLNLDITTTHEDVPAPPAFQYVTLLPIKQFIDMVNGFNPQDTNVESYTFQNFNLLFKNDKIPQYATVVQDFYILFDSFDELADTTLQSSKTMAYGQVVPQFSMVDEFVPDIDEQQVPLLLNEAKSLAFLELKQMAHPKAEQEVRRQWSAVQKNKSLDDKPSYFDQLPYFGRK